MSGGGEEDVGLPSWAKTGASGLWTSRIPRGGILKHPPAVSEFAVQGRKHDPIAANGDRRLP